MTDETNAEIPTSGFPAIFGPDDINLIEGGVAIFPPGSDRGWCWSAKDAAEIGTALIQAAALHDGVATGLLKWAPDDA